MKKDSTYYLMLIIDNYINKRHDTDIQIKKYWQEYKRKQEK